jgi:hypothetical protein
MGWKQVLAYITGPVDRELPYAPQRQAVTLKQTIVVATAGLHIPRNSCVQ